MAAKGFSPTLTNGDIAVPMARNAYAVRVNEEITALWGNVGFNPMIGYGATGDGTTDDATSWADMLSDISAAGGGVVNLTHNHRIGSALTLPSNILIKGNGKVISAPSSGAIAGLFQTNSTANQSGTISSNAALFDRQLTLTSATGFSVGRIIELIKTVGGGVFYNHMAEIVSVVGNVIQITPPMPFALLTSDTYTLNARQVRENITIENLIFDGNSNASATRGMLLQRTKNLNINQVYFKNFLGGAGAYIDAGIGTQLTNMFAQNCGTGSEAAFNIRAQTDLIASSIEDRFSAGFGQLWFMVTNSHMAQLSSNRAGVSATGRGVKFDGCLYCSADQVEGNDSSATGIAVTLGSNFNTFSNFIALRNRGGGGNDVGLWFDGTSGDNTVNNVLAKNNQTFDIQIPTGSDRNAIINADYDTISNTGIDNLVIAKQSVGAYQLLGWADVNFNSANTDHAITIKFPTKYWRIGDIFVINNGTTASLTTARGGVFTATGGGGTTIAADQVLSAITSNAVNGVNGLAMTLAAGITSQYVNYATLYYRTSTAQGAAATGRVYIMGRPIPA